MPSSLNASGGCALTAQPVCNVTAVGVGVNPPGTVGIGVGVGLGPGVGVPVGLNVGVGVGGIGVGVATAAPEMHDEVAPLTCRGFAFVSRT